MAEFEIIANYNKAAMKYCEGRSCSDCIFGYDGCNIYTPTQEQYDAVMNPPVDWSKVKVDTKILVRDYEGEEWLRRYFAKFENGKVYAFDAGATSWSSGNNKKVEWNYVELAEEEGMPMVYPLVFEERWVGRVNE